MKVISLLQPWATLVVTGAKKIETRCWNTKFRGDILIHASAGKSGLKMLDKYPFSDLNRFMLEARIHPGYEFPLGSIIGKVTIMETVALDNLNERQYEKSNIFNGEFLFPNIPKMELAFGDYSPGRFGWLLSDPVSFKDHHYPVKGSVGLWNFDEEICLRCGCTVEDACVHPEFGECWWADSYLCSHCTGMIHF